MSIPSGFERGADTGVPLVKPISVTLASPGQAAARKTDGDVDTCWWHGIGKQECF